jgi:hypothetical protein
MAHAEHTDQAEVAEHVEHVENTYTFKFPYRLRKLMRTKIQIISEFDCNFSLDDREKSFRFQVSSEDAKRIEELYNNAIRPKYKGTPIDQCCQHVYPQSHLSHPMQRCPLKRGPDGYCSWHAPSRPIREDDCCYVFPSNHRNPLARGQRCRLAKKTAGHCAWHNRIVARLGTSVSTQP